MTSAVSLGLLVLLEAQSYHSFYRSGTNRSCFLVVFNILRYFVARLLVPLGLGVLLSCTFVCLCLLPTVLYIQRVLNKTRNTFCGTWYLPHSHVHNERTVPIMISGCMAHARNGRISTSGLKSDVTIVFLDPDFF